MPTVRANALRRLAAHLLEASGSHAPEAQEVATALVASNLAGIDSHGVGYLPRYLRTAKGGRLRKNVATPRIVADTGACLTLDADRAYGQVAGRVAMEMGIERAAKHGVCVVRLQNSHHLGRIGGYAEIAAHRGFASVHFVNVTGHPGLVAPYRGREVRLGTNPLAIGFPAPVKGGPPIITDFATSRIALGKVREAMAAGKEVPPGCLLDADGRPTQDPKTKFVEPTGALLPAAEHKGYALALMCELFASALSGGMSVAPESNPDDDTIINSMLSIIIGAPDQHGGFLREAADVVAFMKSCPRSDEVSDANGAGPVLVPGEPEMAFRALREVDGIPVPVGTWAELIAAGGEVGVGVERFAAALEETD
eukprot:Opistho-2@9174